MKYCLKTFTASIFTAFFNKQFDDENLFREKEVEAGDQGQLDDILQLHSEGDEEERDEGGEPEPDRGAGGARHSQRASLPTEHLRQTPH